MTTSAKHLKCTHCDREMHDGDIRVFQKVIICHDCDVIASRLLDKIHKELDMLKALAVENIRVAIIEKRLINQTYSGKEPTNRQVLQEIINLQRRQESKKEPNGG